MKQFYFVEFTDTYGGDANYSWAIRYKVFATSFKHAITLAKKERYFSPLPRHKISNYGEMMRIDIVNSCVCAFVEIFDDDNYGDYNFKILGENAK